jgi:hypothetical protein
MKTQLRVISVLLAIVLFGTGELFAAEKGRRRSGGDAQWYADPERGWIKSDERRDRREERRESPRDRRSDQKGRDKGKGRGSSNY